MKQPELWRCPKCGKRFISKNMWHSCRVYDLEPLFAKCEPQVLTLYKKFEAMVLACGPVIIEPKRTGIAFQVRVRTIGCIPRKTHLQIVFAFDRPPRHRRFFKVTTYTGRFHAHWIEVCTAPELDAEVLNWIHDAYALSAQKRSEATPKLRTARRVK